MTVLAQLERRDGVEPEPKPFIQNRFFVLVALTVIAICFVYLGRASARPPVSGPDVKVIVSDEGTWTSPAGSKLGAAGRYLRTTIFRYLRLPAGVPAHLAGMILCTVLAGLALIYNRI